MISVLYGTGLVGLCALIAVVAFPAPSLWRLLRDPHITRGKLELIAVLAIFVAAAVFASFSETFRAQFLALFFWIPLGLLYVWRSIERGELDSAT